MDKPEDIKRINIAEETPKLIKKKRNRKYNI